MARTIIILSQRSTRTYMRDEESDAHVYGAGALAGLFAGVVMALAGMGVVSASGGGFWTPMKEIAATWMGVDALVGGGGTVVAGVVTHLVCAAFWGALFSSLIRRRESAAGAFWEGIVYGVGVWLVMSYIGLPIFDRTMIPRVALRPDWWFYQHLIFGACLCVTPALRRRLTPEADQVPRERRVYPSVTTPV